MGLAAGTRLGPYQVVGAIGAGGMGEVYRARDTRLGRDVAVKVLPEAFAADAQRMERLEREARLLASLNHPNIAAIYGYEDSPGARALVMELVEGQTLADRIAQSPIPIEEALAIANQMAEGLEYAHERGIVHRDLKPANVKITPDGAVKILDFGLAKALEGDSGLAVDPANSPTISRLATQAGIILGTASYMAPEQAKGKSVDRRADIWAFGCVLYEMLTGKHAFDGETVTEVLAAVVRAEPNWSLLPANTPSALRKLLERCLKKDAKQRLQAIGDARIEVQETLAGASEGAADVAGQPVLRPVWRRALPWALFAATLIALGGVVGDFWYRAPPAAAAVVAQIAPPPGETFALAGQKAGPPVISPDGRKLAFVAIGADGKQQLWLRPLDSATAQPLAHLSLLVAG